MTPTSAAAYQGVNRADPDRRRPSAAGVLNHERSPGRWRNPAGRRDRSGTYPARKQRDVKRRPITMLAIIALVLVAILAVAILAAVAHLLFSPLVLVAIAIVAWVMLRSRRSHE